MSPPRGTLPAVGRFAWTHGLFTLVLAAATAVRVIAVLGYPSVLWFGDSVSYLHGALHIEPSVLRPSGYSLFLWALEPFHSFTVVASVQHALGVATGVMVYALVWRAARRAWPHRRGLWGLPATLAAVPVLFDGYQLELEHLLMSDELFSFLMVACGTVVMWRRRLPWWAGGVAGLLLAAAALTRSVGLPLLLVLLVCMLARRSGVRAIVAAVAAFAVPMVAYMSWFQSAQGQFAMTRTDQIWLYGRAAAFADCSVIKPRPELAFLCPKNPPTDPSMAPAYANLWTADSALREIPGGIGTARADQLAGEFARAAILAQPGDYWKVVWRDTFRAFQRDRQPYPTARTAQEYEFPVLKVLSAAEIQVAYPYGHATAWPAVVEPHATWIRDYQDRVSLPGPALGCLLVAGAAGMIVGLRRWGGPAALPWLMSVALLVIPAATADFDYRYVLPAIPFACLSAGLTLIAVRRGGRDAIRRLAGRPHSPEPPVPEEPPAAPRIPVTSGSATS